MIRQMRRLLVPLFALALTVFAGQAPALAVDATAKRTELAALKARAQAEGRVRVTIELRVGPNASRRVLHGIQRHVVATALGSAAWRQRGAPGEIHAVTEMVSEPRLSATVTAAEIDRLAAHPKVRRINDDGRAAAEPKTAAPAK